MAEVVSRRLSGFWLSRESTSFWWAARRRCCTVLLNTCEVTTAPEPRHEDSLAVQTQELPAETEHLQPPEAPLSRDGVEIWKMPEAA